MVKQEMKDTRVRKVNPSPIIEIDVGKTRGSRKKIHQILKGMEVERGPEGPPGSHMTAYLLLQNIQVNYPIVYFS